MTKIRDFFPTSRAFEEDDANIIRDFYYGKTTQNYDDKDINRKKTQKSIEVNIKITSKIHGEIDLLISTQE